MGRLERRIADLLPLHLPIARDLTRFLFHHAQIGLKVHGLRQKPADGQFLDRLAFMGDMKHACFGIQLE